MANYTIACYNYVLNVTMYILFTALNANYIRSMQSVLQFIKFIATNILARTNTHILLYYCNFMYSPLV